MTKKNCFWKGCKTKVEVDDKFSCNGLFVVEGWCDFHHKKYAKQQK